MGMAESTALVGLGDRASWTGNAGAKSPLGPPWMHSLGMGMYGSSIGWTFFMVRGFKSPIEPGLGILLW